MADIAWLNELSKKDIPLVGGKGANLGEMYNNKLPVPPAFIITSEAFKKFLEQSGVKNKVFELLNDLDVDDTAKLQEVSNKIKEMIINSGIPTSMKDDIIEAYDNLNVDEEVLKGTNNNVLNLVKAGRDLPFVAVRSSATAEDLPEASFAGQQETYLNIKGEKQLLEAVKKCWASLYTSRAIFYRIKNNFPHEKVLIAVVVQKMINSKKSGVMFSANPATNADEIVIEAGFGLGEAIVSGAINPDLYILDKKSLEIKKKEIKKQTWMFTRDNLSGNTVRKKLNEDMWDDQKLMESEIKTLGELALQIERHYGKPQDMEFAIDNKVYIVQSRPITTLNKNVKSEEVKGEVILEGLAASAGVGKGKVQKIMDEEKINDFKEGNILVTKMTNPSFVPIMKKARAIVTDDGGITSHAAIVSREMGIPAIVGTEKATKILRDGEEITVDATHGKVYKGVVKEIKEEKIEITDEMIHTRTETKIKANVDLSEYVGNAVKLNPDGVGLMRLEMVIVNGGKHPAEYIRQNKTEDYVRLLKVGIGKIAEAFKGKPVWVRTSDIRTDEYKDLQGGDKEDKEDNPMLGWHGIRRGLMDDKILKAEFRAIKELHDSGLTNIGVMLPFLISVDELKRAKDIIRQVGLEPRKDIEFGVMVETPASVWIINELCEEGIDFISFGTNDLTQTTLGVDRNNEKLASIFDEMHPAVLRELEHVINVCKRHNVETSICGQAASRPEMVEYLVKLGIDSLSCNVDSVGKIRLHVAKVEKEM